MNLNSGKLLHIGINYVVAPITEINEKKEHEFQGHLMTASLGITDKKLQANAILAIRKTTQPLEIKIGSVGPQLAQLLVVAPNPNRAFEIFIEETDEVVSAFNKTWMEQNFQIIHCDAAIRHLYDSTRGHAFSELWEDRLGMKKEVLGVFGRPVLGGGLRFVMPQRYNEEDPKKVEVKIESFIREPKQVFIEVRFDWNNPVIVSDVSGFRVADRLNDLENFIENRVHEFMQGAK
jgi:hypothetical protein